ncbi:YslB family protein [Fructobacillus sp. M1-13]|uniref:YslB family protein n=1 Tax=Fructobacillus papyriferae TaxID=2713171 RepID=A0ABS5QNW1_9LACO|nr:YslB family protein [Fructobacillus papyriferae]MBS9334457.1 YslB family protein [Fructobacillus papyriferae]MCD2158446.1 YslB family protein [Fructobacillus papyriferae]
MANDRTHQQIGMNRSENAFASLLLRDALLQNLLTDDYANITYWAGKELARQFPLESIAEIANFFEQAGFGNLTITYQGEAEQQWLVAGPVIKDRLALNRQADFSLEAGFLAQQVELQNEAIAESYFQVNMRKHTVTITVMVDNQHRVESLTASEQVALRDRFFDLMDEKTEAVTAQIENSGAVKPASESHMLDQLAEVKEEDAMQQPSALSEAEDEAVVNTKDGQSQVSQPKTPTEEWTASATTETTNTPVENEEDSLSVEQSITNSLLAFDPKSKKHRDSKTALDF